MARVYVSIGSNIDRERNIVAALDALSTRFGMLIVSSVYESEAVGFEGDHFLNLVVGFETNVAVSELSALLREIEHVNGRNRGQERFSARTLDIDILTYGDCVGTIDGISLPRQEITENAFVLLPLAEIAADECHPVLQKTFAVLWREYNRSQKLWTIDFYWQDRQISKAQPA